MSSGIKNIRVRGAKLRDIGLFNKLWTRLLEQQSKNGSIILASEKTLDFYKNLFNLYIEGKYKGLILFVADKGVLMLGDNDSPLDCFGKSVMNWGCYAESDQAEDIRKALWDHGINWAKENKFTAILSDKYNGLDLPEDFKIISTLMYKEL